MEKREREARFTIIIFPELIEEGAERDLLILFIVQVGLTERFTNLTNDSLQQTSGLYPPHGSESGRLLQLQKTFSPSHLQISLK